MPIEPTSAANGHVPANRRERRRAVRVLLSGPSGPGLAQEAAVDRFLAYVDDQKLRLFLRVGQAPGGRPLAAAGLAGPGRAAMVLASPLEPARASDAASRLLRALCTDLHGVRVAQALLDAEAAGPRRSFEAAGFEKLATLVYLEAAVRGEASDRPTPPMPAGLEETCWSARTQATFERAVAETYVGTLDCPGLVGRRPIAEVLAGHRAAGGPAAFAPARWRVYVDADGPAAVLLLARLPHEPTLEVVYLGVCPGHRGRGLGRWLLRHAFAEAARSGADRVALAADAANRPALRLYRSSGFRTLQRRAALAAFRVPEPD